MLKPSDTAFAAKNLTCANAALVVEGPGSYGTASQQIDQGRMIKGEGDGASPMRHLLLLLQIAQQHSCFADPGP